MPASAILGDPPKAPKAPDVPDIEDVLGPPPRPPSLGKRGKTHAFGLIKPYRRGPSAPRAPASPRIGRDTREEAHVRPRRQKLVIEDRRKPEKKRSGDEGDKRTVASSADNDASAVGKGVSGAARRAAQAMNKLNPLRDNRPGPEDTARRAKRAEQYQGIDSLMADLRRTDPQKAEEIERIQSTQRTDEGHRI